MYIPSPRDYILYQTVPVCPLVAAEPAEVWSGGQAVRAQVWSRVLHPELVPSGLGSPSAFRQPGLHRVCQELPEPLSYLIDLITKQHPGPHSTPAARRPQSRQGPARACKGRYVHTRAQSKAVARPPAGRPWPLDGRPYSYVLVRISSQSRHTSMYVCTHMHARTPVRLYEYMQAQGRSRPHFASPS